MAGPGGHSNFNNPYLTLVRLTLHTRPQPIPDLHFSMQPRLPLGTSINRSLNDSPRHSPATSRLGGRNDTCIKNSMDGRTHPDRNRSRGQIVTSDAPSVISPPTARRSARAGKIPLTNPNPHPEPLGYNPPPPHKTSREGKLKN